MFLRGKHLKHLSFIPGRLIVKPGSREDYRAIERFHYVAGPPATWVQIWTIYHEPDRLAADWCSRASMRRPAMPPVTPIAVAVLSYPCLNSHARDRALNLKRLSPRRRQRFVNQHIRTLSRIIIHPTYRGLGLASILIDCILTNCPTRYTEALATMARAHPLFARSAMKEFPAEEESKPSYFLFDRDAGFISPPSESSDRAANRR